MLQNLSSAQLRAARGLLNWSRPDLAKRTGVSAQTIHRFENNLGEPESRTQDKIYRALNEAGLEFTERGGVQFKSRDVEIFEGKSRYDEFYDFIYEHLKLSGGDVCVMGPSARLPATFRTDPEIHRIRMRELQKSRSGILMRILIEEGDSYMPGLDFSLYRWLPKEYALPMSFYVFGTCLALVSFDGPTPPFVVLIKSAHVASAYRKTFELAWRSSKSPASKKLDKK